MASSRNEARQNLLNTLRALALEGSLKEWTVTILIVAIPMAAAVYIVKIATEIVNAVLNFVLTLLAYVIGTRSMQPDAFILFYYPIEFLLVMLAFFAVSRLLRRII